jgi:hypothetical protein
MTTRTIVTSQPDVSCDVCERRLLRGEQPDVFLAAGRRRIVCELCAPRAVHEGWMRESDRQSVSLPPLRPRRGRSLFDRLAVPFRVRQAGGPAAADDRTAAPGAVAGGDHEPAGEQLPYDFLEGRGAVEDGVTHGTGEPGEGVEPPRPRSEVERALDLFNASEYPRRVAGVARSLGAPEVNARSAEHARSVVRIVVAWELCWYRYEVDLDEPEAGARSAGQGTELEELAREDRQVNAVADDAGALSLSGT